MANDTDMNEKFETSLSSLSQHSSLENVNIDSKSNNSHNYIFDRVSNDSEMRDLLIECQNVIKENKHHPIRIYQGSSGSYFIPGSQGRPVGVFKPGDEEPYGQLNPKWTKWLHKTCCPCFFGRGCLMTNVGYISEVGASVVDRFFKLDIVPYTELVELSSNYFVYPIWTVVNRWWIGRELPRKIGSFQVFVEEFESFPKVYKEMMALVPFPPELQHALQLEFEKLVILDYLVRNTDRTLDNLLIHLSWTYENDPEKRAYKLADLPKIDVNLIKNLGAVKYQVKLAGIDNGLAFPYKHPDRCRSYPYEWIHLPQAHNPFSQETIEKYLPLLSNPQVCNDLIRQLETIFAIDLNYSERHFKRQMSVLRGQIFNLTRAMKNKETPFILAHKKPVVIEDEREHGMHVQSSKKHPPLKGHAHNGNDNNDELSSSSLNHERLWMRTINTKPCFTFC